MARSYCARRCLAADLSGRTGLKFETQAIDVGTSTDFGLQPGRSARGTVQAANLFIGGGGVYRLDHVHAE